MAENEQVHDTWMEIMCSRDLWSDIQGQRDLFFGILESFVSKHNYWIFLILDDRNSSINAIPIDLSS